MININPFFIADFYKFNHPNMHPNNLEYIYSNFTPRTSKYSETNSDKLVVFGIQYALISLTEYFDLNFFNQDVDKICTEYEQFCTNVISYISSDNLRSLHTLGYLPISVKAIPEGKSVPMGVPIFTITNTVSGFGWLIQYLETWLSAEIWPLCTTATNSYALRNEFINSALETSDTTNSDFTCWQAHDFSMRGMFGITASALSGMAHILSNYGTDTVPAIKYLEKYYNCDSSKELIASSVPATEHSVMCMKIEDFSNLITKTDNTYIYNSEQFLYEDGKIKYKDFYFSTSKDEALQTISEFLTFKWLITEKYPSGIVSIVSDTYDYWRVISEFLPALKEEILARTPDKFGNAKVVIRPDSGTPENILCGDDSADTDYAKKGTVESLWDLFGGEINSKGYKQLSNKIGVIYGDSMNFKRICLINNRLKQKGFASTNWVAGVGSYFYTSSTRDSYGMALKATLATVNDKELALQKNPKTDSQKKSAKGYLKVTQNSNGNYQLLQNVSKEEELTGELFPIYKDGILLKITSLSDIRRNLNISHIFY